MEQKKEPKRILVTSEDISEKAIEKLENSGLKCDITIMGKGIRSREEVLQELRVPKKNPDQKYDAVLLANPNVAVDEEFLIAAGDRLKVISTMSAGYDHLNVTAIQQKGIKIGHTPAVLSDVVADLAVCLMLAAARRIHEGRMMLDAGEQSTGIKWMLGQDVKCSTVGIYGLGHIGKAIVKRLEGFGVKFIYYTPQPKEDAKVLNVEYVDFKDLLSNSDFIMITAPLNKNTANSFGKAQFAMMKKNAVLVNVARGQIVKTDDLVKALKDKTIFAAGLDVTEPEPLPKDHDLLKLPNVVITPHLGSATGRARTAMALVAAQNVINGLLEQPLEYEVQRVQQ